MTAMMEPLKTSSLKEVFITRFEDLILTGKLAIGEKLPPERELALKLGVSRPVVHEGLLDLAAKGLVTIRPRIGTVVNDYRMQGSLPILESLISFRQGNLEPELLHSLLAVRVLVEVETARLASRNRTDEHIAALHRILDEENKSRGIEQIGRLDFELHHLVALASGNLVYPLLVNSFKPVYTALTAIFFSDQAMVPVTLSFHCTLAEALEQKNEKKAVKIMTEILAHGEQHLLRMIAHS